MSKSWLRNRGTVVGLLIAQAFVFWLSLDMVMQISFFCAAPGSSALSRAFGLLHLLLLALVPVGLISLALPKARPAYILVTLAALAMLPIQYWLVEARMLSCDGP